MGRGWVSIGVFAVISLLVLPGSVASVPGPSASPRADTRMVALLTPHTRTPIQHVIFLIQENHAFDNYLWDYPGAFGLPPGGILEPTTKDNVTRYSGEYEMNWNYVNNQSFSVPVHSATAIPGDSDNQTNDGFTYTATPPTEGLYPPYIVANLLGMAQEYSLGDNFYTAFAGPTLPNRFYYYSLTSGNISGDLGAGVNDTQDIPILAEELEHYGISWNSYDGNYNEYSWAPCIITSAFPTCPEWYFDTTLSQLTPLLYVKFINNNPTTQLTHERFYNDVYADIANGKLPAVSWFTSDWVCCTEHPSDSSFQFIGGNVSQGQQSWLSLVHYVEDSPYWNSTAIFLLYDESGGFFDHDPAPWSTPRGSGLRVPFEVISPYSKEGYVSHEYYDPSSLLHFVEWNWGIPGMGVLDNESNIPLDFFNFSAQPRPPLPESVYGPSNLTTQFPWSYTQPVAPGLTGTYVPELVNDGAVNWTYQAPNSLLSSPALSSTTLYVCGMDATLRAFEPVTGIELWSHPLHASCRSHPTSLPGGAIAATTVLGGIQAFNANGTPLWNLSLGSPIYANLTQVGSTLYGVLQNGTLFAVAWPSGTLLWERHVSASPIYAAPVYDPQTRSLLLSATDSGVEAVNLTGFPLWTAPIPGGVSTDGALCGSTYYVTSPGLNFYTGPMGGLFPVTVANGIVGTPAPLNHSLGTPLCSGNTLYVGDNTTLWAYSLPSLAERWSLPTYGQASGTPTVIGNDLVFGTQGGNLEYVPLSNPASATVLRSGTSFFGSVLATPSGQYFTAEDGNLYSRLTGGEIRVQVTPANATVDVSGTPLPLSGGMGKVLEPAGSYTIHALAPGYMDRNVTVPVSPGKITSVSLSLSPYVPPPTITSFVATPASLYVGGTLYLNTTATGGTTPYTYVYKGLPSGCTSSSTPAYTCTPTAAASYSISVTVTDKNSLSATSNPASVTVKALPAISAFTVSPQTLFLGGTTYLNVTATGSSTLTYAYSGLPSGCTSANSAKLTCVPAGTGTFSIGVTVTDTAGNAASKTASLTVNALPSLPTITAFSASPQSVSVNQSTNFTVVVSGGTTPYTYAYTNLPTGCSSRDTATLPCVPTVAANYVVTVTVTDTAGHTAKRSLTLTVTTGEGSGGVATPVNWMLVGVLVAILVMATAVFVWWARRRRKTREGAPPTAVDGQAPPASRTLV